MKIVRYFTLLAFVIFMSCEKHKENFDVPGTGQITIKLNLLHELLGNTIPLNYQTPYQNALNQTYFFDDFRMYISNITLRDTTGTHYYKVPESYHLVEMIDNPDTAIVIKDLPNSYYTEINFSVGVDNNANYSTDQIGDLDPANGMAWDWNTGYKFLYLKGERILADSTRRGLVYHIGSDANYRTIRFTNKEISLDRNNNLTINLDVHVDYIFGNKNLPEQTNPDVGPVNYYIDLNDDSSNDTMYGPNTQKIADNYAQMFEWKEITVE
ncbi:MbnP family protein [Flammeovirga pacifica]|uniref:Copper-binding protein MbnP-like domain-containing protein n=1 Tax=Flammeovirga pacifica TaxID=915059 RepID=A0A1S1YVM7_FLAPC|nr:MbnP family protein [Flammeovirga pacifica]OHX64913.1 hypothetical protein NH26_00410 [Flammeovirga pacifica]